MVTGPHDFDGSFLKNLLTKLPAVVIVFTGGTAADSTSLTLDATWTLYVVTGWQGGGQATRRREALTGAYAIATALMVRLHTTNMGERQYSASGTGRAVPNIPDLDDLDGFGKIQVTKIVNEGAGEWERMDVAVYSIELEQNIPLGAAGRREHCRLAAADQRDLRSFRMLATSSIPTPTRSESTATLTSRFDMPQT